MARGFLARRSRLGLVASAAAAAVRCSRAGGSAAVGGGAGPLASCNARTRCGLRPPAWRGACGAEPSENPSMRMRASSAHCRPGAVPGIAVGIDGCDVIGALPVAVFLQLRDAGARLLGQLAVGVLLQEVRIRFGGVGELGRVPVLLLVAAPGGQGRQQASRARAVHRL